MEGDGAEDRPSASSPAAEAAELDPATMPKLRILALHGYRQNGALFKGKIGSFRKAVNKYATITFLTAPHPIRNDQDSSEATSDPRGWWFNAEDGTFKATRVTGPAIGFTESLQLIEKTFAENGPFDGIMGFSQGASLVGMLAAMQQKGLLSYKFKFAIMASGFCSGSLVHKNFYDDDISLPSLHIFGETDKIIPKEMSETLGRLFTDPIIVEHEGGHYLACSGLLKTHYKEFLSDMLDEEIENFRLNQESPPKS